MKYLKYKWFWFLHDLRMFFTDKLPMKIAFLLPKKIQLWGFIAVCSHKGDCPDPFYSEYYNSFCKKHNISNM